MTREEAMAVNTSDLGPFTKEQLLERHPDVIIQPDPTESEIEEADRELERIESEEKEDIEALDGGEWPPKIDGE